ncbi:Gx transporter family protein [Treponema sp.]|uniref:Gx transporter family protein n=1 Tax=Treponema sp. TaxID=166 RepID=UPI00298E1856|nr:Gx transporter family protein [Treponema sp.]MCQ2240963.1 Gx transporter family protein [Treponema sp.]
MRKLAFFSALCFFLSAVEYAIPKPVPFFRLGLANLPIMISFLCMTRKESTALIFLKVLLQGIISGTLFSYIFLFSLAGSLASGFVMMAIFHLFYERKLVSWLGISMAGGLANNLAQLGVAFIFLFGENTKFVAPVLLAISFVASIAMGLFANVFVEKSKWLADLKNVSWAEEKNAEKKSAAAEEIKSSSKFQSLILVFSLLMFILLFFSKSIYVVTSIFLLSIVACLAKNKKVKFLPSLAIILSVTFFSILVPHGKILVEIWKLKITDGAILSGLERSIKLCSCVFLSKLIVNRNMKLPSKAGLFMSMLFEYFEKLSEKDTDKKITFSNFVSILDEKLEKAFSC